MAHCDFGIRLRQTRRAKKVTQEALGKRINVSRKTVLRWEAGDGLPSGDVLLLIAEALKTNPWFLLGWREEAGEAPMMSADESHLLALFRELNEAGKEALLSVAVESSQAFAVAKRAAERAVLSVGRRRQ